MSTASLQSELRAGGTDVSERRRSGLSTSGVADVPATTGMRAISWNETGAARIGALTTIAAIAADARLAAAYPGLTAAAAGLATPQVRHMATIGGNLAQRTRCWYFRNPQIACLKKGGDTCPSRDGNHLFGVAFDLGPCVAPHPSTLAAALSAYDATIDTDRRSGLSIVTLLGDGSNGRADHDLAPGEIITAIALPPPVTGERAAYKRAVSRSRAEWPLAEIVVRAVVTDGAFALIRVSAGGIAPVPMRLSAVEAALQGARADAGTIAHAAGLSRHGAKPLPMTGYKLDLLQGLVRDVAGQVAGLPPGG